MVRLFLILFLCIGLSDVKAQDTALVFGKESYHYLSDTVHPMFADTLVKEHVDFVPILITGTLDSLTYVNDTLVTDSTWILNEASLRDPNFIFIVQYIETSDKAAYFKLKKVQIIYKKTIQ